MLHLAMNMLALLALGPFVERILLRWRYTALLSGSGITQAEKDSLHERPERQQGEHIHRQMRRAEMKKRSSKQSPHPRRRLATAAARRN